MNANGTGKGGVGHYALIVMTAEQAAEFLGVTTDELALWVTLGRGPVRRSTKTYVAWEVATWARNFGTHRHTDTAQEWAAKTTAVKTSDHALLSSSHRRLSGSPA